MLLLFLPGLKYFIIFSSSAWILIVRKDIVILFYYIMYFILWFILYFSSILTIVHIDENNMELAFLATKELLESVHLKWEFFFGCCCSPNYISALLLPLYAFAFLIIRILYSLTKSHKHLYLFQFFPSHSHLSSLCFSGDTSSILKPLLTIPVQC